MVSPSTLNRRPRFFSPTGTSIPVPSEITGISFCKPSLAESMIQRTISSPICCCTSMIAFSPWLSTCSAVLIFGRGRSSNATSTTGPMTWTIFPICMCHVLSIVSTPLPHKAGRYKLNEVRRPGKYQDPLPAGFQTSACLSSYVSSAAAHVPSRLRKPP